MATEFATASIPLGAEGAESVLVVHELTVAHHHPDMPEVYGTPYMVYLMEVAAANAVQVYLPPGWVTVGSLVNVCHLAAARDPLPRAAIQERALAELAPRGLGGCSTARSVWPRGLRQREP